MGAEHDPLHKLMERVGEQVDILSDMEQDLACIREDYRRVVRRLLIGGTIMALFVAASLAMTGFLMRDIRQTATQAAANTASLKVYGRENRRLIRRLEMVADDNRALIDELELVTGVVRRNQCDVLNRLGETKLFLLRALARRNADRPGEMAELNEGVRELIADIRRTPRCGLKKELRANR